MTKFCDTLGQADWMGLRLNRLDQLRKLPAWFETRKSTSVYGRQSHFRVVARRSVIPRHRDPHGELESLHVGIFSTWTEPSSR